MSAIPITGFYAGLLGLILLWLSLRIVVAVRAKGEVSYGDAGNPDYTVIVRGQGNFIEYVPMILILMAVDELGGTSAAWLHGMGVALVIGRLLHPFGLTNTAGVNPMRLIGTLATWIVLATASIFAVLQGL